MGNVHCYYLQPACVWNSTAGHCHTRLLSVWRSYGAVVNQWQANLQHILATQWLRFEGHDHRPDFRIAGRKTFLYHYEVLCSVEGSSVAKWLVCWTRAQKCLGSAATLSGNSLRQIVHTHCASVHQAAKLVAALLRVAMVTAGLMPTTGFMTLVTCRLTAKYPDQLQNPISVIEYGLPLPLYILFMHVRMWLLSVFH